MERVVSGIRSTGNLHLGNYFGALKNFIKMQNENECFFFIADYHSLTTHPTPANLHGNVRQVLAEYLAAGIDPEKATIYVQSDVPEVAELYLLLNMNAYVGELERTTSFKDKVRKSPNNVNAGLLTYPVLMAADIIIHHASKVPVGKDQEQNLEIIFVANGDFQRHFRDIVNFHGLHQRVAICDFDERLARIAYGASDFVLMPSRFEPCGLPQMIGLIYGSLPVAHDTGGIHDTVVHMDIDNDTGNGFLFKTFDSSGLLWAIRQAMLFYNLPQEIKARKIEKIMTESIASFNHAVTARKYIDLYEKMLERPLIN